MCLALLCEGDGWRKVLKFKFKTDNIVRIPKLAVVRQVVTKIEHRSWNQPMSWAKIGRKDDSLWQSMPSLHQVLQSGRTSLSPRPKSRPSTSWTSPYYEGKLDRPQTTDFNNPNAQLTISLTSNLILGSCQATNTLTAEVPARVSI